MSADGCEEWEAPMGDTAFQPRICATCGNSDCPSKAEVEE